jgi:voltage-gated potassium channel
MRRHVLGSVVRLSVWTSLLIGLYALAPLGSKPGGVIVAELALALLVFAALVSWQIITVIRSPYPGLRAAEAVAVSLTLLILVFASTFFVTEQAYPGSFTQSMTRIDAVYFTVTVFASVGFGDITAKTEAARILVTIQMMANLVMIGLIAKVLFGAVQQRRQALGSGSGRLSEPARPATPEHTDP